MRVYYSGEGSRSNPEIVLRDKANLMLTFWDMYIREGRPTKRFRAIIKKRKKGTLNGSKQNTSKVR